MRGMMVSLPSVLLLMLLSVARATGPGPAALASVWPPALAVLLPSVLLMLLSVARATGPGPAALASVWAPALAVLLPMTPGL